MLAERGVTDLRDGIPKGGSYRYSDGQADSDQWVVGGDHENSKSLIKRRGSCNSNLEDEKCN